MKNIKRLIFGLFVVLGVAVMRSDVYAQSVSDRNSDYQRDLDIYRNARALFDVKKSEFTQFGTFAAEEELITATRQVLLARDDVWITYWQLLAAKFDTLSAEASPKKGEWLNTFKNEISWLDANKVKVAAALTRDSLRVEANALNNKKDEWGTMAFNANGELAVSVAVMTTKNLLSFSQGLKDRVNQQQLSASEKDTKTRGLTINADRINALLVQLGTVRENYNNDSSYTTSDSFSKITQDLDPINTAINQQYQVASELSSGVEW